jgi:hypothetical protein
MLSDALLRLTQQEPHVRTHEINVNITAINVCYRHSYYIAPRQVTSVRLAQVAAQSLRARLSVSYLTRNEGRYFSTRVAAQRQFC